MDSEQDAIEQLSRSTNLDESIQSFCQNPFSLGDVWHEWGACSNFLSNTKTGEVQPLTPPDQFAFDHFEEELLDGCGLGVYQPLEQPEQPPATEKRVANQRFAPPKTKEEIKRARLESIPKKTRQDTEYCVRLWNSWAENRKLNN